MKNAYMFFSKQEFADINLEGYDKKDINIPQTDIYIFTSFNVITKKKMMMRIKPKN